MVEINWAQTIIAFASGGAAGAIINNVVSAYRSRRQPIGHRIEIIPVFHQNKSSAQLSAKIAVAYQDNSETFDNLFLAEIQITNKGNIDISEFDFGITLGGSDLCIHVESKIPDRHHNAIQLIPTTPNSPKSIIDFKLKPFNRGASYFFTLYLVVPPEEDFPKNIKLGSASPVIFIELVASFKPYKTPVS